MTEKTDIRCWVEDCYIQNVCSTESGVKRCEKFLWAIVIDDRRGRFRSGFFFHSSRIERVENGVIYTRTGSEYVPVGEVFEIECELWQYAMMRTGTHPRDMPPPSSIDNELKVELVERLRADLAFETKLEKLFF